jgi:hypothetical protein
VLSLAQLVPPETELTLRGMNDVSYPIQASQLGALLAGYGIYYYTIYNTFVTKKVAVQTAESIEEIQSI